MSVLTEEQKAAMVAHQDTAEELAWTELLDGSIAALPSTWTEEHRRRTAMMLMAKDIREVFGLGFNAGTVLGLDVAAQYRAAEEASS